MECRIFFKMFLLMPIKEFSRPTLRRRQVNGICRGGEVHRSFQRSACSATPAWGLPSLRLDRELSVAVTSWGMTRSPHVWPTGADQAASSNEANTHVRCRPKPFHGFAATRTGCSLLSPPLTFSQSRSQYPSVPKPSPFSLRRGTLSRTPRPDDGDPQAPRPPAPAPSGCGPVLTAALGPPGSSGWGGGKGRSTRQREHTDIAKLCLLQTVPCPLFHDVPAGGTDRFQAAFGRWLDRLPLPCSCLCLGCWEWELFSKAAMQPWRQASVTSPCFLSCPSAPSPGPLSVPSLSCPPSGHMPASPLLRVPS